MSRIRDRRLAAAEGAVGIKRKPPFDAAKLKAIDDWLELVTGKTIDAMSCDELARLERLFRVAADTGEPMGDDAAELVLACMDANQPTNVVDLERRRQQLDEWRPPR